MTTSSTNEPPASAPAIMRNYHEVLRNDLYKVLTPLLAAADIAGFANAWRDYTAAIAVHAAMEDGVEGSGGGTVAMLDHYFDGAAQASMFIAEHAQEHAEQAAVTAAVKDGIDALRAAFGTYCRTAEAHLLSEEAVLQPLVVQLPVPKAPKFAEWCVSAGIAHGGFEHFVAHGVRSLSMFGSTKNPPVTATRVFVQSLKAVSTAEQWAAHKPIVLASMPDAIWEAVVAEVPSLAH